MIPTVHWLGGWASSLACWEPMLRERFPGFKHRFVDSHAFLDSSPTEAGLIDLPAGHVAAAWSMGALLAHRWIEGGAWPSPLPLLSLCPVFRFTQPGGFGEPVLLRMEKKITGHREIVLRDFWRRMPKAAEIPRPWEQAWLAGTERYTDAELTEGLEFLRKVEVDSALLPLAPSRWELIVGEHDRLAPPGDWELSLPAQAEVIRFPGGHLPFWECPEAMLAALGRLTAIPGTTFSNPR